MTRISVLTISSVFGFLILIVGCATNYEKSSKTFNAIGYDYFKRGEYNRAIEQYNNAIELNPQNAEALNMQARINKKGKATLRSVTAISRISSSRV